MRIKLKPFIWSVSSGLILFGTGEIFARYYLGLGTPPLSIVHPTIEYMNKPNQDVYRFGNHFFTNQYGMRSEAFPKNKVNGNELRIMVFGDSVVNGGNLTDQNELATSILKDRLSKTLNKNVIVGNISAGSWGLGNWLAYVKEYGFFDADIVVLVISSHDYVDNPTFAPLNKNTHPTEYPNLALIEGVERYLPRYLPQLSNSKGVTNSEESFVVKNNESEAQIGLKDLKEFLNLAKSNSRIVLVFQHLEKWEIDSKPQEGYQRIKTTCEELGIIPTSLDTYFRKSIESGVNPYRDMIHPNRVGQMLIAKAILAKIQDFPSFKINMLDQSALRRMKR
ncbi:MAG: SGNH/GDSL hydrolase family protein [Pseudanabaena sp. ELA645]